MAATAPGADFLAHILPFFWRLADPAAMLGVLCRSGISGRQADAAALPFTSPANATDPIDTAASQRS
jgi:hypothetical protein